MSADRPIILVVEDELLVAMDIEDLLADRGWSVLGPAASVGHAMTLLAETSPDIACLDMNLNGTTSAPIAAVLNARGIPFVLVTGYSERQVTDPAFRNAPLVSKPFASADLLRTLEHLLI